jgi:coenzyme F420-0:L-glutamate ligase/coenzyme F420-1:gamma-L-glutamate ligase
MTTSDPMPDRLEVWAWEWPEIRSGHDLATIAVESASHSPLVDGDVVVLTSKAVSKAEGAVHDRDRAAVIEEETVRVVARRGSTVIAQTRHGLVLAAAGVDASNVPDERVLTLPADPDASARLLRVELARRLDVNVAVIVSDTAGRAWRTGQTDIAIGCAGIDPLLDLRGLPDASGHLLAVTTPAVADEIAALGDLVKGKASRRPVAVVRGLGGLVLPRGTHGPGAAALVREPESDLFGLGAREAVVAAAARADSDALSRFPTRADGDGEPFEYLESARSDVSVVVAGRESGWTIAVCVRDDAPEQALVEAGRVVERSAVLAAAYRLVAASSGDIPDIEPLTRGWRAVHRAHWGLA